MKNIQAVILDFLDTEANTEEFFVDHINIFNDLKTNNKKHEFKSLLYLISKISNGHHRGINFYEKIERILLFFKDKINENFSNKDIFNIFKSNKRILLFLFEAKMIEIDEYIIKRIIDGKYLSAKYPQYFSPEIKSFINLKQSQNHKQIYQILSQKNLINEIMKEIPDNFNEKRKIGENDSYICSLIRNDSIDEFVAFIEKNNYSRQSLINSSIYETNSFLIKNQNQQLIEYAAFFGSIQIFHYLRLNGINLTPNLWLYAIHSKNADIIHLLEENHIEPNENSYRECLIESIKCHHNDICKYILNSYLLNEDAEIELKQCDVHKKILECYNFSFIKTKFITKSSFYNLCKYDYYLLVKSLIRKIDYDINNLVLNDVKNKKKEICTYKDKSKKTCTGNFDDYTYKNIKPLYGKNIINKIKIYPDDDIKIYNHTFYFIFGERKYKIYRVKESKTALYTSVEKENLEIIKLLLTNDKININTLNKTWYYSFDSDYRIGEEETALYAAVKRENIEIIKILLTNNKIDMNILNKSWYFNSSNSRILKKTALYLAVEKENIEVIKHLLTNDNLSINILNKKKHSYTYVHQVEFSNSIHDFELAKTRLKEETSLYAAIKRENFEIIKLLLTNHKLDINVLNMSFSQIISTNLHNDKSFYSKKKEVTALYAVLERENIGITKLLLANDKIDINICNKICIFNIVKLDSNKKFKLLDFNNERKTVLYSAIEKENLPILNFY